MDVFAHTLWAAAGARKANEISEKKNVKFRMSPAWTAFWGVFPDLFAFTIPIFIRIYYILVGSLPVQDFLGRPSFTEGGLQAGISLAHGLYNYSHSLVIWSLVFALVWLIYKKPRYELLGWALHVLIDIPSHVLTFFPTPFLFPFSDYRFPYGVEWSNRYFMIINYSLLLIIWGRMLVTNSRARYALK